MSHLLTQRIRELTEEMEKAHPVASKAMDEAMPTLVNKAVAGATGSDLAGYASGQLATHAKSELGNIARQVALAGAFGIASVVAPVVLLGCLVKAAWDEL